VLEGLMYPDILGKLTENRIDAGRLQYAVGISPSSVMLNGTVRVVVLLQSTTEQNMMVRISVRPPGGADIPNVQVKLGKKLISLGLGPGEVGALTIPLMPTADTPPNPAYPVQVAVRFRVQDEDAPRVRLPQGGIVPEYLSISPYKVRRYQENVTYEVLPWHQSVESVTAHFELQNRRLPPLAEPAPHSYETLWDESHLAEERDRVQGHVAAARASLAALEPDAAYPVFVEALQQLMRGRGDVELQPGEVGIIATLLLAYLQAAHEAEIEASIWFATLAQALAHNPSLTDLPPSELMAQTVLGPLLTGAAIYGVDALDLPEIGTSLGIASLTPPETPTLSDIYAPLVLAGLLVPAARYPTDAASLLDALEHDYADRRRTADPTDAPIMAAFERLLAEARAAL